MYGFALRPRWIASHVLVLVLVVVMVNLGFWQLRRLDERQERNALVRGRMAEPVVGIEDLLEPSDDAAAAEDVLYRRVEASGRYLADEELLVRSRSLDGSPGAWVLAPLETADGEAVVVNRGWVPVTDPRGEVPDDARAPEGAVEIEGLVFPTQERGRFGPRDPQDEELESLARADVERLQAQVDPDLYPAYVQLREQQPAQQGELPVLLDPPELDEGPHLSYAVQWFIFSTIALVGYPLVLRRVARTREPEAAAVGSNGRVPEPERHEARSGAGAKGTA